MRNIGKKKLTARLHWLDYGPRRYDPATTFWTSPDPLSAARPDISPYAYCAANPAANTDPSGYRIVTNFNGIEYDLQLTDESKYAFFDTAGHQYLQEGSISSQYFDMLIDDLNTIGEGRFGSGLLNYLISREDAVSIELTNNDKNGFVDYYNKVVYNPSLIPQSIRMIADQEEQLGNYTFISLGHELFHATDKLMGSIDNHVIMSWPGGQTMTRAEYFAMLGENFIRTEHGIPKRTHYAFSDDGNVIQGSELKVTLFNISKIYSLLIFSNK